jgi:hypothetical protein
MIGYLKIGGALAAALLVAAVIMLGKRTAELTGRVRGHEACAASIKGYVEGGRQLDDRCRPEVKAAAEAKARAVQCDQALAARPENLFAARAACSTPVKTLLAQRDAAAADRDSLKAELAAERAGRVQAIARAEARAKGQAQRDTHVRRTISALPPAAGGLRSCDARCLRELAQAGGRARP